MIYYVFKKRLVTKQRIKMKIFRFVKQTIISAMMLFSYYLPSTTSLSCISVNNLPCKARHEIINISKNNPAFHPFSIGKNKCTGIVIILMIPTQKFVFLIL